MYFEDQAEVTAINAKISTRASIVLGATTFGILTIMIYPSIIMSVTSPIGYLV